MSRDADGGVRKLVLVHGRAKARAMVDPEQRSLVDIAAEVMGDDGSTRVDIERAAPRADVRSGPGHPGDRIGCPVGALRPDPVAGDPRRDAALRQ